MDVWIAFWTVNYSKEISKAKTYIYSNEWTYGEI